MGRVRRVLRWVLVGRRDGVRAGIRQRLGWFTWLDRHRTREEPIAPEAAPAPAPVADEPDWHDVLGATELAPGDVTEVVAAGRAMAIANVDGELFAVSDTCPHAGGPLGEGWMDGAALTCPLHGWTFDVRTGECHIDPDERLERFDTRVRAGRVQVRVPPEA